MGYALQASRWAGDSRSLWVAAVLTTACTRTEPPGNTRAGAGSADSGAVVGTDRGGGAGSEGDGAVLAGAGADGGQASALDRGPGTEPPACGLAR